METARQKSPSAFNLSSRRSAKACSSRFSTSFQASALNGCIPRPAGSFRVAFYFFIKRGCTVSCGVPLTLRLSWNFMMCTPYDVKTGSRTARFGKSKRRIIKLQLSLFGPNKPNVSLVHISGGVIRVSPNDFAEGCAGENRLLRKS